LDGLGRSSGSTSLKAALPPVLRLGSSLPVLASAPELRLLPPSEASFGSRPVSPCSPASSMGSPKFEPTPDLPHGGPLRLLLVRHAQSANKARRVGQPADADPGLTDLGFEEADELANRMVSMFSKCRPDELPLVVSSPMRRCLLTIYPTVRRLPFEPGLAKPGTPWDVIASNFPEFEPTSFGPRGSWDYRGSNDKETGTEFRTRGLRVAQWLQSPQVRRAGAVILVVHQTVADLLCQILVDGTDANWEYGELQYRLRNASITELFLQPSDRVTFGMSNSGTHLQGAPRR